MPDTLRKVIFLSTQELRRFPYDKVRKLVADILEKFGYPRDKAETTAWVLVEADARGVPSHGVTRVKVYKNELDDGHVKPNVSPKIVFETPISMVIDGGYGIGGDISKFAVEKMLEKAEKSCTCYAAVRNSNHFGMAGLWAEKLAAHGYIGMAFTNTIRCAVPTFGCGRMLGTNPIAVAIPSDMENPFMLDMATTAVARGKLGVYKNRNMPLKEGWVVDEQGKPITDPKAATKLLANPTDTLGGMVYLGGSTEEMGGHKGYGLGLLVDMLCGPLSGGAWTNEVFQTMDANVGHFFGAIKMDLFGQEKQIRKSVGDILRTLQNSPAAPGHERVYTAGQKENIRRAKAIEKGVEIDEASIEMLKRFADEYNVSGSEIFE